MNIKQILESDNLAASLDEETKEAIRQQVITTYENDLTSRTKKNQDLKDIISLGMLEAEGKANPWPGCSNVMVPVLAGAAKTFADNAFPEVIKDFEIVKCKVIGRDDGKPIENLEGEEIINPEDQQPINNNAGEKQKRGDRVATYMNWQLNCEIKNWVSDMDRLFYSLSLLGTLFKKVYYDPDRKKPCVDLIYPNKIIINDNAIDIKKAPISHVVELYTHQLVERIRSDYFIDFEFNSDQEQDYSSEVNGQVTDDKAQSYNPGVHTFIEQHCWFDLDNDGYQEPYIVTIYYSRSSGELVRMIPRFTEEDIIYTENGKKIQRIKAHHFFTKYIFMPSPDGSFYGQGLGHLCYPINNSINSIVNQLIDAGTLSNLGGGFISKSFKISSGDLTFKPGEWKLVDNFGMAIDDGVKGLPVPQPSPVLLETLSYLTNSSREMLNLNDGIAGDAAANMAATTGIIMADKAAKPFKAIYKRIYLAMQDEFSKLFKINSRYLTDEKYLRVIDESPQIASVKYDFDPKDYDIVPVADLESINTVQRMAMANFYSGLMNNPVINIEEATRRMLQLVNITDIDKLINPPSPQQPNPAFEIEMLKQENRAKEVQIEAIKASNEAEKIKFDIEKTEAEIDNIKTKSLLNLAQAEATEKGQQLKEYQTALDAIRRNTELEMQRQEQAQNLQMQEQEQNNQIQENDNNEQELANE